LNKKKKRSGGKITEEEGLVERGGGDVWRGRVKNGEKNNIRKDGGTEPVTKEMGFLGPKGEKIRINEESDQGVNEGKRRKADFK